MASGAKRSRKTPRVSRQEFYMAGMILYVIVLDAKNAGDYTLFQGFSVNALDEFAAIREICRLPAHVDQLFSDRNEVARRRMYGQTGYSILLLESELFGQLGGHVPRLLPRNTQNMPVFRDISFAKQTGENELLSIEWRQSVGLFSGGHKRSPGFSDSIARMQRDHKPMMWRK